MRGEEQSLEPAFTTDRAGGLLTCSLKANADGRRSIQRRSVKNTAGHKAEAKKPKPAKLRITKARILWEMWGGLSIEACGESDWPHLNAKQGPRCLQTSCVQPLLVTAAALKKAIGKESSRQLS